MDRLLRHAGSLLIGTGVLHTLIGFAFAARPLAGIRRDGIVNAIHSHPERQAWVWFMFSGWSLIALGQLVRWEQRQGSMPPRSLGWHLTAMGAVLAVLMPVSGGWLLLAQGILLLRGGMRRLGPAVGVRRP